jgi:hypothetical protein
VVNTSDCNFVLIKSKKGGKAMEGRSVYGLRGRGYANEECLWAMKLRGVLVNEEPEMRESDEGGTSDGDCNKGSKT